MFRGLLETDRAMALDDVRAGCFEDRCDGCAIGRSDWRLGVLQVARAVVPAPLLGGMRSDQLILERFGQDDRQYADDLLDRLGAESLGAQPGGEGLDLLARDRGERQVAEGRQQVA